MLSSLSEFEFLRSTRIPIEEVDQVRILVEKELGLGQYEYIADVKICDISMRGIGMVSSSEHSIGESLRFSINFKRMVFEVEGEVVRVWSSREEKGPITYGVVLEELPEMKRFMQYYISSLPLERLRECLQQLSLTPHGSRLGEGVELLPLTVSLFLDLVEASKKDEDFLPPLLWEVAQVLNAERACVRLIHPESNSLREMVSLQEVEAKSSSDYRQGIAGLVFTSGMPLNIDTDHDTIRWPQGQEKRVDQADEPQNPTNGPVKSVICYPFRNASDKVVGVVEVVNKQGRQRFSINDEEAMEIISMALGIIFRNHEPMVEGSLVRGFSTPFDRKHAIIGHSVVIKNLRRSIVQLKDIETSILIQGEEGVGKSLLAQVLHSEGRWGGQQLTVVDSLSLSEQQMAAKLLGKEGLLSRLREQGGGLIVKNGDRLSPGIQYECLRMLHQDSRGEEGRPQWASRIIMTSVQDLEQKAGQGEFSPELFEYFSKAFLEIPPLRKRLDDIESLVLYFLKLECRNQGLLLKSFSPQLLEAFRYYEWPGNIRELRHYVERAVTLNPKNHVICKFDGLAMPKLKKNIESLQLLDDDIPWGIKSSLSLKERMSIIERKVIDGEIRRFRGNKSRAAAAMGISREALRKKLLFSQKVLAGCRQQEGDVAETGDKKAA